MEKCFSIFHHFILDEMYFLIILPPFIIHVCSTLLLLFGYWTPHHRLYHHTSAVIEDQYNPRLVKELLQDLSLTLNGLAIHAGGCVLVGNINVWLSRINNILKWQQQLNNLQIPKVNTVVAHRTFQCGSLSALRGHSADRSLNSVTCRDPERMALWSSHQDASSGFSFNDLPLHTQSTIIFKLSDACDIINLGQAMPTLQAFSENRTLWKKLCYFHFSDNTVSKNSSSPSCSSVNFCNYHQVAGLRRTGWQSTEVSLGQIVTFKLLWLWQLTTVSLLSLLLLIIIII